MGQGGVRVRGGGCRHDHALELRGIRRRGVGCLDKPRAEVGWMGVRCQQCEFCLSFSVFVKSRRLSGFREAKLPTNAVLADVVA